MSHPGVFVEELPSGVHPINGVATSITTFIGRTLRGPTDPPGSLNSFNDFERLYGGLWTQSTLGYAVAQFFLNGGSQALIVRVHNGATAAKAVVPDGGIALIAANAGAWGNSLRARIDLPRQPPPFAGPAGLFDLSVKDLISGRIEIFPNLSTDPKSGGSGNYGEAAGLTRNKAGKVTEVRFAGGTGRPEKVVAAEGSGEASTAKPAERPQLAGSLSRATPFRI